MIFYILAFIYFLLDLAFFMSTFLRNQNKKFKFIEENNVIEGEVVGNVVEKTGEGNLNHAVFSYVVNGKEYRKECFNGLNKKNHELGDIFDISYDKDDFTKIYMYEDDIKYKFNFLEILIMTILTFSIPFMIILSTIF